MPEYPRTADGDVDIEALLASMTLEEKCAQLGSVMHSALRVDGRLDDALLGSFLEHGIGQIASLAGHSVDPVVAAETANAIQLHLRDHTRLGIPAIVHEEALEGLMAPGATQFPQAIGMAASWDPELVGTVAEVAGRHARALGANLILSPVLDIARDPRWGRTEETFGEDPELVSRLGVAFVRGMQRNGVECCAKHFLAHGSPLAGLNHNEVVIGPRRLRDVDALPFRSVIHEAGLRAVMNAYHEIDGLPIVTSSEILGDFLRGELGFDGCVVADYFTIDDLEHFHRVAHDRHDAAAQALRAGLDIELPKYDYYATLPAQVRAGTVEEALVDRSCRRILEQKRRLGLFEHPFVDVSAVPATLDTEQDRALARLAATRTMVLLTNDGTLPLRADAKLAVLGPSADSARRLYGDYSFAFKKTHVAHDAVVAGEHVDENAARAVTPLAALAERFEVVDDVTDADVAVVFVGGQSGAMQHETSGEFLDASDLRLPAEQRELIERTAATGVPTVVVVIGGRVHSLTEPAAVANSLLMAWLPGDEGGHAIADVLAGDVDCGGRLPMQILRTVGQVGLYSRHHHGGGRSVVYGDYIDNPSTPLFDVGHGLSYTTWSHDDLRVTGSTTADDLVVSVTVRNTGGRRGDEVVQVYVTDEVASVGVPARRLVAFRRITLDPGTHRTLEFTVPAGRLGFHGADMRYRVEPGAFTVRVGQLSERIVLTGGVEHPDPNHIPPFSVR